MTAPTVKLIHFHEHENWQGVDVLLPSENPFVFISVSDFFLVHQNIIYRFYGSRSFAFYNHLSHGHYVVLLL
jgi:hypothetical protein